MIEAGCMDCDHRTRHLTLSNAQDSLLAHQFNEPDHRLLVATPANGWHRYFTGLEE